MACLSANQLSEYIEGVLPESERAAVDEELARCDECRALLCAWAQTTLCSISTVEDPQLSDGAVIHRRGDRFDAYELLDYLGAGGMGLVFTARDVELDREVAIKVVHPSLATSGEAAEDLLSEARAMAAIKHANVVNVYAAGRVDGLAFIAMEKVEGAPLPDWLDGSTSRVDKLAVFAGVARGLAAFHELGFVHSDVKPSNILVDVDGTAKLADFGLARRGSGEARVGTPAFMAPEVAREGASAASDQYSFCLTLEHAWPDAPRRVAAIASRGLAVDPRQRWPDMGALAEALDAQLRRPRRLGLVLAGAVGLAASCALVWAFRSPTVDEVERCLAAVEGRPLWGPEQQASVRRQFVASERAWAVRAFERVDASLAATSARLEAARRGLCRDLEDPRRGEREICLARVETSLVDTVELLARADAQTVDSVAALVEELADPDRCTVDAAISSSASPLAAAVARAELLQVTGDSVAALAVLEPLAAELPAVDEPRLVARYWLASASATRRRQRYGDAAEALDAAAEAAVVADDEALLARVHAELAIVVGYFESRPEAGAAHLKIAAAFADGAGDPRAMAKLEEARGLVAVSEGRFDEASAAFTRALAIYAELGDALGQAQSLYQRGTFGRHLSDTASSEADLREALAIRARELGDAHPDVIRVYGSFGLVAGVAGDLDASIAWFERAVREAEAALGPDDPELAVALHSLGSQEILRGDFVAARRNLERALAIRRQFAEPDDLDVGRTLVGLASMHYYQGAYDEALVAYREALEVMSSALGGAHREVGIVAEGLGVVSLAAGDVSGARRHIERAVAIARAHGGDAELAAALNDLGLVEATAERWEVARELVSESLAVREGARSVDHPDWAFSYTLLAEIELELGELDSAERSIQRAIAVRRKHEIAPSLIAECEFILAKIQWRRGQRRLARANARAALETLGDGRPDLGEMIHEWLRSPDAG